MSICHPETFQFKKAATALGCFSLPLYCSSVSLFSWRCWFRCSTETLQGSPVRVCFVIQITGFIRYNHAENKCRYRDTSLVQGPPCVSSQATNCAVSYSDHDFSPLGALSWIVIERTLLSFLCLTYCHTPPQHRSSPLSLKARCCLATPSKTLVVQLAQYNKSMVTVCLSSNMADRKLIVSNDVMCKGSI